MSKRSRIICSRYSASACSVLSARRTISCRSSSLRGASRLISLASLPSSCSAWQCRSVYHQADTGLVWKFVTAHDAWQQAPSPPQQIPQHARTETRWAALRCSRHNPAHLLDVVHDAPRGRRVVRHAHERRRRPGRSRLPPHRVIMRPVGRLVRAALRVAEAVVGLPRGAAGAHVRLCGGGVGLQVLLHCVAALEGRRVHGAHAVAGCRSGFSLCRRPACSGIRVFRTCRICASVTHMGEVRSNP